jgi:hypothetical protein
LQNIMTRRSKLVSVSMATLLFVLPLAGLSACSIPMPAMRSMTIDGSDMAVGMPPVSIQQGPLNASCCQLSVALTSPVSVVGPPERGATSIVTMSSPMAPTVRPVAARAEFAGAQPRGSGRSLQAVLCVFLI